MLPLTVAEHELVRLHVRGASESQPGLRRPWRTEPEKMQAACVAQPRCAFARSLVPRRRFGELRRLFESSKKRA